MQAFQAKNSPNKAFAANDFSQNEGIDRLSPLSLSLETLLGVSPILGHSLESRAEIRQRQDLGLLEEVQSVSDIQLEDERVRKMFAVAPLDVLVESSQNGPIFHIIELNGSGIGGLTNMTEEAVSATLKSIAEPANFSQVKDGVFLVGSSGMESAEKPRRNRLIYEKILYAEALRNQIRELGSDPIITTASQYEQNPEQYLSLSKPIIVVGYLKELLAGLSQDQDRFYFYRNPVRMIINDRLCLNALSLEGSHWPFRDTIPANGTFLPGADKGVVYRLLNEFLPVHAGPYAPRKVGYQTAKDRQSLIEQVYAQVKAENKCLIKPQGTGLSHGIEFFLDSSEPLESITTRIDESIAMVNGYYGLPDDGAFPYTICDYIDTAVIQAERHALQGHKYELRIVVYRDGMKLRAFPTIIKASAFIFDAENLDRSMLINNITASSCSTQKSGVDYMLPLCNFETLQILGLNVEELASVCKMATNFVRYTIDEVIAKPSDFMLSSSFFE
jgi:hypothetical protein